MPPDNFARVAVFLPIRRVFDYRIPHDFREQVVRGSLCSVPFHGSQERGLVLDVLDQVSYEGELSEVAGLVLEDPVGEILIQLGKWLAESTLTPLGQVFNRMIPSDLSVKPRRKKVYEISVPFKDVKGFIEERRAAAPKQVEVLETLLSSDEPPTGKEVRREADCSRSPVNALVERGLLERRDVPDYPAEEKIPGLQVDSEFPEIDITTSLDSFAFLTVHGGFNTRLAAYEGFIEEITSSEGVLLVTPNIFRAEEMERILAARGYHPITFHSGLTPGEVSGRWQMARSGDARLFIGVLNSIYLPFESLGGIIVEGEGHRNYQLIDQDPRGDLVEICFQRGEIEDIPVLLGDSAPSVGTYHEVEVGRADSIVGSSPMGSLSVESLREVRPGPTPDRSGLGEEIIGLIASNLRDGGRTLVIGERTSASSAMICRDCGEVIRCPECEVPLKFTSEGSYGVCPYCGYRQDLVSCPNCGGTNLNFVGPGLEQVANELEELFPGANIGRFNTRDSGPAELSQLSESLLSGEVDLLVGTWAVASYFLYGKTDLLCLLGSDLVLDWSSYRSTEWYLKRMARGLDLVKEGGTVVAQTYHSSNPSVRSLFSGDWDSLYKSELRSRKALDYPPFVDLIELHYRGSGGGEDKETISRIKELLVGLDGVKSVLGPVKSARSPTSGDGGAKLLIKSDRGEEFLSGLGRELTQVDMETIRLVPFYFRSGRRS